MLVCCDIEHFNVDLIYLLACRAPHNVQVQLGECMKSIVLVDFPDQWPSLLPQLTQNLHSQVLNWLRQQQLKFSHCTKHFDEDLHQLGSPGK